MNAEEESSQEEASDDGDYDEEIEEIPIKKKKTKH